MCRDARDSSLSSPLFQEGGRDTINIPEVAPLFGSDRLSCTTRSNSSCTERMHQPKAIWVIGLTAFWNRIYICMCVSKFRYESMYIYSRTQNYSCKSACKKIYSRKSSRVPRNQFFPFFFIVCNCNWKFFFATRIFYNL